MEVKVVSKYHIIKHYFQYLIISMIAMKIMDTAILNSFLRIDFTLE
jgi:hypothetical protein